MFRKRAISVVGAIAVFTTPFAMTTSAEAATAPCRQNVYGYGGYGTCIKAMQVLISTSSHNYYTRSDIGTVIARDGSFGSRTLWAVKKYQSMNGLVVDGRVGSKTWQKLCVSGHYWGDNMTLKSQLRWAQTYAC
ncbi:peptidoglycan-binding domain-containing protein [Janibacter sp. Soil728]|uniref:peptidoglycan-binding domain-containing protein n=1 Tax=Janibacter sp. Soil728 TaxID=1736393 RepID=UPI0009E84793|nr:peptidoglycan-binding protein [Janibacter sp. Soil728]